MLPWLFHLFRRSRQRDEVVRRRKREDLPERNEEEEHLRRVRLRAARRNTARNDRAGKKA